MLVKSSEASGDGPPAAGPGRLAGLTTRSTDRGNQALDSLLPELRDDDSVPVMDAGSILAPGFFPRPAGA
jgi:hypothetical protein